MSFFNESPTIPLSRAIRRYWLPFALMAAEPILAFLVSVAAPSIPFGRAVTAVPALMLALYPPAFGSAPVSYWLSACAAWFSSLFLVLAFTSGGVAA